ncbi:MAG: hypothetical protein WC804_10790 [Sphingomonas sp.]|jgi:hypothetical protein|uniref:hypothetical protein n=1 Tax=Sphingomonas sp. TaxID=28214 RepID=UPI0035697E6A
MFDEAAQERISLALARQAYARREVRLVEPDIGELPLLVSSRQGLFAADRDHARLVAHGLFFGVTFRGDLIYAFESCDLPHAPTNLGRIIRLRRRGGRIVERDVLVEGLDNGCHQIDFIGDRLCVLDTYNQRILAFAEDGTPLEIPQPLAAAERGDWDRGYRHVNAILAVGDRILLMLHNGDGQSGRSSQILVLDRNWQQMDAWDLPHGGCHDLAFLPDGTLLACGSPAGELIALDGRAKRISPMMTRGLAASDREIVVGASQFSTRRARVRARGALHFLDSSWHVTHALKLVAAPTCVMWLDRADYGCSQPSARLPRAALDQRAHRRGRAPAPK